MADQKISQRTAQISALTGTEIVPILWGVAEFKCTIEQISDYTKPATGSNYANDVAAAAGGIAIGELYHTAGTVKIRLT